MERVQAIIDDHKGGVFFFSKDGCKHCDMLEKDLEDIGVPFTKLKLGVDFEQDIVDHLKEHVQHKTYPMLFFGSQFIGGYAQFQKLCYTAQLQARLKEELNIAVDYEF